MKIVLIIAIMLIKVHVIHSLLMKLGSLECKINDDDYIFHSHVKATVCCGMQKQKWRTIG